MVGYGKMAQCAVAVVSYLAERYASGDVVGSAEVARVRNLSKPLVAKVLTMLSQAGYVRGAPGPGGGYRLEVAPEELTLKEVVGTFERVGEVMMCPFGPGYCGTANPCPMHDEILAMGEGLERFLSGGNFGMFCRETEVAG